MPLALHFLPRIGKKLGKPLTGIATDTVQQMQHYAWPGNIRELENRMKRAVLMSEGRLITAADLELAAGVEDLTAYDLRTARQCC